MDVPDETFIWSILWSMGSCLPWELPSQTQFCWKWSGAAQQPDWSTHSLPPYTLHDISKRSILLDPNWLTTQLDLIPNPNPNPAETDNHGLHLTFVTYFKMKYLGQTEYVTESISPLPKEIQKCQRGSRFSSTAGFVVDGLWAVVSVHAEQPCQQTHEPPPLPPIIMVD